MPISIPVPTSSWEDEIISLGGREYKLTFRFNTRDQGWRIDLYLGDVLVKGGMKVVQDGSLLLIYQLDDFSHGDIWCIKAQETTEDVGRNNLGQGKAYELIYFSNEELANPEDI